MTALPQPHPTFNHVQRIRLEPDAVEQAREDARAWFAARGRREFTWWIGRAATPPELEESLRRLGAREAPDADVAVMVLDHEPESAPGVETRRVDSVADLVAAMEIRATAFGLTDEQRRISLERARSHWQEIVGSGDSCMYVAVVAGTPVGFGNMMFPTTAPPLLMGGSTMPDARGRGVYRALVHARWHDAVRRGHDRLIVHAGGMSRPILERLGFEEISRIRVLLDDAG